MTDRRPPSDEERFNPELATAAWKRRLKASEPGRLVAAFYRRRRAPRQILRAPGGRRTTPVPPPPARRRVRVVCWMPAGPGDHDALLDTYASALASSPGEVALLVTDDWTPDCDAASIQAAVPDAVVVRPRIPSGGPPRLWPVTALAIGTALTHFDFDYLVKLDTDALVVGPGWAQQIDTVMRRDDGREVAQILEHPVGEPGPLTSAVAPTAAPAGIGGAFQVRPDGELETDRPYHQRVLRGEAPHDARLAGWYQRALANGWPDGSIVQGGTLVMTQALCAGIVAEGGLTYHPRLRTIVSEDLLLTLFTYALGMRAVSLGGPLGPLAIANKHLPLELGELLDPASRWLVTHSTKVGLGGEREPEIRSRARAARAAWPAA